MNKFENNLEKYHRPFLAYFEISKISFFSASLYKAVQCLDWKFVQYSVADVYFCLTDSVAQTLHHGMCGETLRRCLWNSRFTGLFVLNN
jgi:hypothetical protein